MNNNNPNQVSMEEVMSLFQDKVSGKAILKSCLVREISSFVSHERMAAGLTQKEFAAKIGLSQTDISNIESGNINFTLDRLADLADKLGCEVKISFHRLQNQTDNTKAYISYMSQYNRFTISSTPESFSRKEKDYASIH